MPVKKSPSTGIFMSNDAEARKGEGGGREWECVEEGEGKRGRGERLNHCKVTPLTTLALHRSHITIR